MADKIQYKFERYEKKYFVTPNQQRLLLSRLGSHIQPDAYGAYTICNLYYDTDDWQLIRASIEKPVYKEKLRVRSYGVPQQDDKVFVELKKKFDGVVYKRRICAKADQSEALLNGIGLNQNYGQVGREIDWFQQFYHTKPKVFIAYDRTAFAGTELPDLRITFDSNLRWRDTELELTAAIQHGEGYGYYSGYKFYVMQSDTGQYMAVFLDCNQQLHALRTLAAYSLLAVALCILLVYILVMLFSKKAIAPVIRSVEKQKQFITDASHELKTPITVIATSLKVLEMEVGKQKWIDKAQGQTEKLTELVGELVTLSRMDEEESPLKLSLFPVSDAAAETAESFRDYAQSKGLSLEVSVEPGIQYCGDEYATRQLCSILLDNAIKYAVPDTVITFALQKSKKGILIRTSNRCEPIDPADLNRLFDRFYRADKSRNAKTGGFGIGLSIARSIAEGHKGSIKASCPEPDTIEFIAELK